MNYKIVYSLLVAAFISCDKHEIDTSSQIDRMIDVQVLALSENYATKVSYDEVATNGSYAFNWEIGDKLSIIAPNNDNQQFTATQAAKKALLTGSVAPWSGEADLYGIYPYSSTAYTITAAGETTLSTALNRSIALSTTPIAGGSHNINKQGYLTTGAKATATSATAYNFPNLPFRQVMSFIRFNIEQVPAGNTVTKIVLSSTDATKSIFISKAIVNVKTANLTSRGHTFANAITIPITGSKAGAAMIFDYALFPCNFEHNEITIAVYGSNTTETILYTKTTDKLAFMRNHKYKLTLDLTPKANR